MTKKKNTEPLDAAFAYLTAKPRTVRETELYLDGKQYGEYEVYAAVERLKELNYLDDEKYAADFIATRLATKPVSRRKLRDQMFRHKLPKDIIDSALEAVTDDVEYENARLTAKKFFDMFITLPDDVRRERVIRRLVARGYSYDAILRGLEGIVDGVDESELQGFEYDGDGDTDNDD